MYPIKDTNFLEVQFLKKSVNNSLPFRICFFWLTAYFFFEKSNFHKNLSFGIDFSSSLIFFIISSFAGRSFAWLLWRQCSHQTSSSSSSCQSVSRSQNTMGWNYFWNSILTLTLIGMSSENKKNAHLQRHLVTFL